MIVYYMGMAMDNQKQSKASLKINKQIDAPESVADTLMLVGFFVTGLGEGIKSGLDEFKDPKLQTGGVKNPKAKGSMPDIPEEGLGMLGLGFTMARQMVSGVAKSAISFVDSQWNNALALMTRGISNKPLSELTPQINASMQKLAFILNNMSGTPESRQQLRALSVALGQTGVRMIEIARPAVAQIVVKSVDTAGKIGSIAARRGIQAGINVLKTGVSVIPGVNVAVFGSMTVISAVAGAVRIAYELTQNANAVGSIAMQSLKKITSALQGTQSSIANATNKTIIDNKIPGELLKEQKIEDLKPEDVENMTPMQSLAALKKLGLKGGRRKAKTRRGGAKSTAARLKKTLRRFAKTLRN